MRISALAARTAGLAVGLVACIGAAGDLVGQQGSERAAIERAALDYGLGWYEGDAERMRRALHPELAKRMVLTDPGTGRSRLSQQGAMTLVDNTASGGGRGVELGESGAEVTIFEVYENAAVAKVEGPEWVDYLHLAKWNGEWRIVNVLWELHPETRARMLGRD